jgi:hypothetical protein
MTLGWFSSAFDNHGSKQYLSTPMVGLRPNTPLVGLRRGESLQCRHRYVVASVLEEVTRRCVVNAWKSR